MALRDNTINSGEGDSPLTKRSRKVCSIFGGRTTTQTKVIRNEPLGE